MAATSYSTLPSNTYIAHGSQGDSYHSNAYGTYNSGIGSLAPYSNSNQTNNYDTNYTNNQQQPYYSNAYQQPTTSNAYHQPIYSNDYHQPTYSNDGYSTQQYQNVPTNQYAQQTINNQQQQQSNSYSQSQTPRTADRPIPTNNNTGSYAAMKTTQPLNNKNANKQHIESKNHQQTTYTNTKQNRPPAPVDNQYYKPQSNLNRSDHKTSNQPPKQQQHKSQPPPQSNLIRSENQISKSRTTSPPIRRRSPSNDKNNYAPETVSKTYIPLRELKPTKSSTMRAAANKKKEENRELKRKDQYFPSSQSKVTPTISKSQQASPQTDHEQSDTEKIKNKNKNKKQSHSLTNIQKASHINDEQHDVGKKTRNKKKSHSQPKQRKSRHDKYQTDDNNSSNEDDNHKRHRSKSQKRTTASDSYLDKHPHLPPLRHGRMPPHYDPYIDYPLPPGHPLRGRFPYYGDYPPYGPHLQGHVRRHRYGDADDIPPYVGPYHDPYDPFFDYEKRKVKPKRRHDKNDPHTDHEDNNGGTNGNETERDDGAKSQQSRKSKNKKSNNENTGRKSRRDYDDRMHPYWPQGYYPPHLYDGRDMLEMWRQERNDYLKKTYKPTIHDVLYSQQWMKSDSYLENQRRRALRDVQGYYFPYKKYTLKDYKDLQKTNIQNPFADVNETTIDRKERARKRQEYGSLVERQIVDNPGARQVPPREIPPRKPWHLSNGETHDPETLSKRERALEYAKVQVKYRPVKSTNDPSYKSDPNEHYMNNDYSDMNDDADRSNYERTSKTNQLYDDYD